MIYKRIFLDDNKCDVYLDVYAADNNTDFIRKAILVIPGGGYGCVCSAREGEPIGMAFMPHGFNAFVLNYSVARSRTYPSQLIEASLAMKHIKDNADEYGIDPDMVFVAGFSAGGHLAATLGTQWHIKEVYDAIDMPYGYNKPRGMILGYPVITGFPENGCHAGSFNNLWGTDEPTVEMLQKTSLEIHVDERTCPAFLLHTSNDAVVPVNNSLLFAQSLAKAGQKFELHIFPDAPHGIALGNKITMVGEEKFDNPDIARWIEMAAHWTENL